MTNTNQNTALPIYQLIALLEDAKKGYLHAAEKIKDEVLSLLFEKFGYERGRYSNELRRLARQSGAGTPIDQFTLSLLYRTWADLKTAFKFGEKENVIKACIKADENALENYSMAIEQVGDNAEVRMILQQQERGIKTVLNSIKEYTGNTFK